MDKDIQTLVRVGRFREALTSVNALPIAVRRSPETQIAEAELLVEMGDLLAGVSLARKVLNPSLRVAQKARALRVRCQIAFYRGEAEASKAAIKRAGDIAHTHRKS